MTENWTFEGGRIIARNEAGAQLLALSGDQGVHGPLLAAFIDGRQPLAGCCWPALGMVTNPRDLVRGPVTKTTSARIW